MCLTFWKQTNKLNVFQLVSGAKCSATNPNCSPQVLREPTKHHNSSNYAESAVYRIHLDLAASSSCRFKFTGDASEQRFGLVTAAPGDASVSSDQDVVLLNIPNCADSVTVTNVCVFACVCVHTPPHVVVHS